MPLPEPPQLLLSPTHLALLQALLAQHLPQVDVWAYGSRVTGGAHEGSDLDLALRPTEGEIDSTRLHALQAALRDSRLPMMVDVHCWPHLPAAMQADIERTHVVVQAGAASGSC